MSYLVILGCFLSFGLIPMKTGKEMQGAKYLKNTQDFIRYFKATHGISDTSFVVNCPGGEYYSECKTSTLNDSIDFTPEERRLIAGQMERPLISSWNEQNLGIRARIIEKDSINAVFKHNKTIEAWKIINAKYGKEFRSFYAPIFLRNYTVCVFFSEVLCGRLCGQGQMEVYKKQEGLWVLFKTLYTSQS
jgi:hypothetical protein